MDPLLELFWSFGPAAAAEAAAAAVGKADCEGKERNPNYKAIFKYTLTFVKRCGVPFLRNTTDLIKHVLVFIRIFEDTAT